MKITLDTEEIGKEIAMDYEERDDDWIWADVCDTIRLYLSDAFDEIADVVDEEFLKRGVKYEC